MMDIMALAEWIVRHRTGRAFKDYSMTRICEELVECANNDTMLCVTDVNGFVVGVVCGSKNPDNKEFFVYDILTTEPWVIKEMVKYFRNKLPGYSLRGIKKCDIQRHFNDINKLIAKL